MGEMLQMWSVSNRFYEGFRMSRVVFTFLVWFWLIFVVIMVLLYFFAPEVFYRMTQYGGAGGPFVNTPRG